MEQRISPSSIANPEIHPSFQSAWYNMPLPDPEVFFFNFEKKLKNDPSVRQNLVSITSSRVETFYFYFIPN